MCRAYLSFSLSVGDFYPPLAKMILRYPMALFGLSTPGDGGKGVFRKENSFLASLRMHKNLSRSASICVVSSVSFADTTSTSKPFPPPSTQRMAKRRESNFSFPKGESLGSSNPQEGIRTMIPLNTPRRAKAKKSTLFFQENEHTQNNQ